MKQNMQREGFHSLKNSCTVYCISSGTYTFKCQEQLGQVHLLTLGLCGFQVKYLWYAYLYFIKNLMLVNLGSPWLCSSQSGCKFLPKLISIHVSIYLDLTNSPLSLKH